MTPSDSRTAVTRFVMLTGIYGMMYGASHDEHRMNYLTDGGKAGDSKSRIQESESRIQNEEAEAILLLIFFSSGF